MKKSVFSCVLSAFVLAFLSPAGAAQYINGCPLPDNLKITAPDSAVPPKLALLSGIWEGNWMSSALFVVEQIRESEAVVIQAWAEVRARTQAGRSFDPGFFRLKCPVEKGEDGNYRIICTTKNGINKLIQTDDPKQLRVVREGFGTMSPEYRDSVFRKKEEK